MGQEPHHDTRGVIGRAKCASLSLLYTALLEWICEDAVLCWVLEIVKVCLSIKFHQAECTGSKIGPNLIHGEKMQIKRAFSQKNANYTED